jgi:hypothetical protein
VRRSRLIWFAAGAAVAGFASVLTTLLVAKDPEPVPVLVVDERIDLLLEMEGDQWRDTAPLNGKMLRECGARTFEMDAIIPDDGGHARLPITKENEAAFECVFKRSADEGFNLRVWIPR